MERDNLTSNLQKLDALGNAIEQSLASLDARGTNKSVSQAMTIVHIAFDLARKGAVISPELLASAARNFHP